MRSVVQESVHSNVRSRNHARPYIVFRRDDITPAAAGEERARREGHAYVAVRVHGEGEGARGAIVYFDAAPARPPLRSVTLDAIWSAFVDAVGRDPDDDEPLVGGMGTFWYAFVPGSEIAAHCLARRVVDIAQRDGRAR